jgi:arsenical pump membrane protein
VWHPNITPVSAAHLLLLVITALSILLMLARPRNLPEVVWVAGGASLLVLLHLIPARLAGRAIAEGRDVYLFLIGMMLLSELARENGIFDWLASTAIRQARGSCSRLFLLLYVVGIAVTICLSNDATAVVLTPAVLTAVRRARTPPLPYLFACAMIANAASFVLPISNPANLVVFHSGLPSLGLWLASFLLPSILSIAVTFAVLRWYFRHDLNTRIESATQPAKLNADGKLVLLALAVIVGILLICSAWKLDLGLPTSLAAVTITAVLCIRRRSSLWPLAKQISWTTIALVASLFVLVNAVESIGALQLTQRALASAQRLPFLPGALLTALSVGLANNLVNNLPLGLLAGATLHAAHLAQGLLVDAVLIGIDLGPNLSITGSLATILWLLNLRRDNIRISAWEFLKVGALVMPLAMLAAIAGSFATHAITAH